VSSDLTFFREQGRQIPQHKQDYTDEPGGASFD
jgi:hypothetical protein